MALIIVCPGKQLCWSVSSHYFPPSGLGCFLYRKCLKQGIDAMRRPFLVRLVPVPLVPVRHRIYLEHIGISKDLTTSPSTCSPCMHDGIRRVEKTLRRNFFFLFLFQDRRLCYCQVSKSNAVVEITTVLGFDVQTNSTCFVSMS